MQNTIKQGRTRVTELCATEESLRGRFLQSFDRGIRKCERISPRVEGGEVLFLLLAVIEKCRRENVDVYDDIYNLP